MAAAGAPPEVEHNISEKYEALRRPRLRLQDLVVGQWYVENNGPGQRFPVFHVLARNPATGRITIQYHSEEVHGPNNPFTLEPHNREKYHLYLPPGAAIPAGVPGAQVAVVPPPVVPAPVVPAAAGAPQEHYLLTTASNAGTINVANNTTNSISMNSFEEDQPVVRLNDQPGHIFHREGINQWFRQKATNPLTGKAPTRVEVGRAHIVKKGGARKRGKSKKQRKSKSKSRKH